MSPFPKSVQTALPQRGTPFQPSLAQLKFKWWRQGVCSKLGLVSKHLALTEPANSSFHAPAYGASYIQSYYTFIILIVCLCMATLTEVFPCFFLSCKANARVKPPKTGHGPHSSKIFVLFYVLFVLCHSVYCLRVYLYCTTATGWLPNCGQQIYLNHIATVYTALGTILCLFQRIKSTNQWMKVYSTHCFASCI